MTDSKLQTNRLIAMAIDIGILIGVSIVGAVISFTFSAVAGRIGAAIGGLISGLLVAAFMAVRDIIIKGNSVGKHLMKLKVVDATSGGQISFNQSLKRNIFFVIPPAAGAIFSLFKIIPFLGVIFSLVSLLLGLAAIGFFIYEIIQIVSNPDGIRYGDKLANTKVISAE